MHRSLGWMRTDREPCAFLHGREEVPDEVHQPLRPDL